MTRIDVYEPLCYHCLYRPNRVGDCSIKHGCDKCPVCDEHGTCQCVIEKPDDERTCPYFKYRYLRG